MSIKGERLTGVDQKSDIKWHRNGDLKLYNREHFLKFPTLPKAETMFNPSVDPPGLVTGTLECLAGLVFFPSGTVWFLRCIPYVQDVLSNYLNWPPATAIDTLSQGGVAACFIPAIKYFIYVIRFS